MVLQSIKTIEKCSVSVEENRVNIYAEQPRAFVKASVSASSLGFDKYFTYLTKDLLAAKEYTKVEEKASSLILEQEKKNFIIRKTVQAQIYQPCIPEYTVEYTTKISMKKDSFKRAVMIFKETDTDIYLSEGHLIFSASTKESEDLLRISSISIIQEGTEKVSIPISYLKSAISLLPETETLLLSFNSRVFRVMLVFKDNSSHYSIQISSAI
ncbi:hypothetical protein NEFER03_2189 [Nematocida sp. LUAm3]|nr:hypothetical protein NEFER03_2189 [Nematocida sp. LUAm3]